MRKLIIDTDPGTDDAFAIITATKHADFNILGITTVAGNKGIEITTKNALKLVELCKLDCMVYQGASTSLQQQVFSDDSSAHGEDGMGGINLPYNENALSDISAVDFILDTVAKNPNEVELLVIGPVTNIALAIQKDLETMKKVKAIYTMGGGVYSGNMNPVSEFNYWFDGIATKTMFDLGEFVDIHMIGLNVTQPSYFTANDIWFMKLAGGEMGNLLFNIQIGLIESNGWKYENILGNIIHDLLTVMYMIEPSLVQMLHTNVQISTSDFTVGQTVVDTLGIKDYGIKNAYVGMQVDVRKYKELFMDIMFGKEVGMLYRTYVKS